MKKWLLLAVLSLIWGSSFILIKKGVQGFGFIEAASLRMMAAGLAFLPFGLLHVKNIPRDRWPFVVLITLLGMFIPAFLFCLAQQHVQSSVAGMLNALTPVFTFVFSLIIFKKTYRLNQVAGLLIGLISAVMLIVERADSAFSLNGYAGLIVLATMCYGMNINLIKQYLGELSSLSLSAVSVSLGGLLAFVFFFLPRMEHYRITEERLWPLAALVTLGVMSTALATLFYYKLIKDSSPLFASTVTFMMPIVAIFWGAFDGEHLYWIHALSIAGILTGVLLIRKD